MPRRRGIRKLRHGVARRLEAPPALAGPVRKILLTEAAFVLLQRVLHEQMPELVTYGFYEMGFRVGLDLSRQWRGDKESAFRQAVGAYREAGYGDLEVSSYDLDRPEIRLRGHGLLEASAARRSGIHRSPRAVDHYSRGMFAGLVSGLLGKEVICEELRCEYRGDDACEFIVLPFGGAEG